MTEGGISPLPREARPYQGRRAGVVTRIAAATIDSILVSTILGLAYLGLAGLLFVLDPRNFTFPDSSLLLSVASWLVILVVYLTIAWWAGGRTYGDLVLGLRVVAYTGRTMSFTGALIRALLYAIFPVGLLWCAVSRENRSFQDFVLRTSVIYDWQPRATGGAR